MLFLIELLVSNVSCIIKLPNKGFCNKKLQVKLSHHHLKHHHTPSETNFRIWMRIFIAFSIFHYIYLYLLSKKTIMYNLYRWYRQAPSYMVYDLDCTIPVEAPCFSSKMLKEHEQHLDLSYTAGKYLYSPQLDTDLNQDRIILSYLHTDELTTKLCYL